MEMSKKVARIEKTCEVCNTTFSLREKELQWQPGRFCSKKCYGEWKSKDEGIRLHMKSIANNGLGKKRPGKGLKLDKNPAWKGGITYFKTHGNYTGVKYIKCPDEYLYMARKDGYVMEHRIIVAKNIGRCLERIEVVHHIDHNPRNNDINNLMLFKNNTEHKRYEAQNKC